MNKKIKILLFCILVVLVVLLVFVWQNKNKDTMSELSKTKTVIVNKISSDSAEQKITDNSKINEVIKIIKAGQEMKEDEPVPYRGLPHYKLKMLDKNDSTITEINFYYYSDDLSYISFNEETPNYKIDGASLLEIIDE